MASAFKNLINKIFPLRFFGFLIIRHKPYKATSKESFFIHPRNGLKTYQRDDFLVDFCRNKRVLHFGFLDHPLTEEKITGGALLHAKVKKNAASVYGVDVDLNSLMKYRDITGDFENTSDNILDFQGDISHLANKYDAILFPEVLEHLKNPGIALERLRELSSLNSRCKVIITVPNAFSIAHFQFAYEEIEAVHPDHYCYYSPVTLEKLLKDCGFKNIDISLYSWGNEIKNIGIAQNGVMVICNA